MSILQTFESDDEDDTLLFARIQEHVLEHYPNPQRIGCLDHATLSAFVAAPGKANLDNPKYLHIFNCAECTRDLIELRRVRESQREQVAFHSGAWAKRYWGYAAVAVSLCAIAIIGALGWRHQSVKTIQQAQNDAPVSATIDLSSDGVSRSPDAAPHEHPISLPRRLVNLHLILPYYSPAGNYSVTVVKTGTASEAVANGSGIATVNGPRSDLQVTLDLRRLAAGKYNLVTMREGDGAPYTYPLTIN